MDVDQDTGQTILSGMGELHLDIIHNRLKQEYGIETYLGPLQVNLLSLLISLQWNINDLARLTKSNKQIRRIHIPRLSVLSLMEAI